MKASVSAGVWVAAHGSQQARWGRFASINACSRGASRAPSRRSWSPSEIRKTTHPSPSTSRSLGRPAGAFPSWRSLSGIRFERRKRLALTAAGLLAALAAAAPNAVASVPWGAGCTSMPPSGVRTSSTCGASLVDGEAVAPAGAPTLVKRVIAAANEIDRKPYVWGGGHAGWFARGYDCSGAVGYALHGAGLLDVTMVSGQLASWEEGGGGHWISVYANREHVFMVVAGLRFDTRGNPSPTTGPRWHRARVDTREFVARHPKGL